MGQSIQQAVAVFIHGAEGQLLALTGAQPHQGVQADLSRGDQPGRLHQHHRFHILEEGAVGLVQLQIVDIGAGDDTHIQVLLLVGQQTDIPQIRGIGHGQKALAAPILHIFFRAVAAQHHQHLLLAQQGLVKGIEHIGDEIVVERIAEQHTLAAQQLLAREQIVEIQLHPVVASAAHIVAVGGNRRIVTGFQLGQQFVIGQNALPHFADGGVFRCQLIAEQPPQEAAHDGIITAVEGSIGFSFQPVLRLSLGVAIQKETQLAQYDDAEDRVVKGGEPFV